MSEFRVYLDAATVLREWASAQNDVSRLRRARAMARRWCENWSPAEAADYPTGYPGCAETPACFHVIGCEPTPREAWCPSCTAAAPDLDAMPAARKRLRAARSRALRAGHRIAQATP